MPSRFYHREGLAFIKITESLVEVFEDTEKGLSRILYVKPKETEG